MFGRLTVMATAFALAAGSAEAAVVYSQPSNNFGSFASQDDTSSSPGFGNFATTYDNFTLGSSANLQSVDFTGSYFNPPVQGTITAFTIAIYADSSNSPGTQLYSTTVPGNGGETFVGIDTLNDLVYSYAENISFSANAGTEYWLSIVPDLALFPQWGWENSNVGDSLGYQKFFGVLSSITSDSAFTLNDTPVATSVPEPFTLAIFGAGLLGLGALRYRRKAEA